MSRIVQSFAPTLLGTAIAFVAVGCQTTSGRQWSASSEVLMPVGRKIEPGDSASLSGAKRPRLKIFREAQIDEVSEPVGYLDSRFAGETSPADEYRVPFLRGPSTPLSNDEPLPDSDDPGRALFLPPADEPGLPDETEPGFDDLGGVPAAADEPESSSLMGDARLLPSMFWNDTKALFTWQNALVLGVAGGASVAIRDNLNTPVRNYTAEHPKRWGSGDDVLRQFGEFQYQVPVLAGIYGLSLWTENDHWHEFSKAVLSAYGLNAAATVILKEALNTQRPTAEVQNGHYGFPSYHTSSTFTIAAVLDEYYGWPIGIPAYTLAGLVGWSRIDQREHDLADVLFGAVLGVVIGKTVAGAHIERALNVQVSPYYDAQNKVTGVSFEKRY
jgi:membrane-associated phospholipid phosphatase